MDLIDNPIIQLDNLTIKYGNQILAQNLTFSVSKSETVAFLGNDLKTFDIILQTVFGINRPVRGEARVFGQDCWHNGENIRKKGGYVQSNPIFDPKDSLNDLLNFSASLNRDNIDWDWVQTLVDRFKVDPDSKSQQMDPSSRGIWSVILSLIHHPDFLLVEDVFSSLNEDHLNELLALFLELKNSTTVLLATSNPTIAGKLAHRVALFQKLNITRIISGGDLLSESVTRMEVVFRDKPPWEQLIKIENIRNLSLDDNIIRCFIVGSPNLFIKAIANSEVLDFKSFEPQLGELISVISPGEEDDQYSDR